MLNDYPLSSFKPPQRDWKYSIQLNRLLLKPIGAWPLSLHVTITDKIISICLTTISSCLIGFLLLPCAFCTFLDPGDLDAKIQMVGPMSFCGMAAIKYYILVSRGKNIAKCMQHIRLDWELVSNYEKDRDIVVKNAEFGRFLVILCAAFMYGGGVFFCTVMPLFATRTVIMDNESVRVPSFPIYRKLMDPRSTPYFEIVQFLQSLAAYVIYTITIGACSLAAVFAMHACGQFKILMSKLHDLVDEEKETNNNNNSDKRMGNIVEYHLRILCFISWIEELMNEICFVELVGCTLNICFLGYYLLTLSPFILKERKYSLTLTELNRFLEYIKRPVTRFIFLMNNFRGNQVVRDFLNSLYIGTSFQEWEHNDMVGTLTYCTFIISLTFNIFIICYIGELLTEQCKNVGMTSYMVDWYRLPRKKAVGLTLVIAISNSPVKLTAGKLFELSLTTFCSVIKSAVAYLSLLRTLTD